MDVGCGGVGLRTSRGHVVNLYFWPLETEGGACLRQEDFVGRADSPRTRQELLRRMVAYSRRKEQEFAGKVARLENSIAHVDRRLEPPHVIREDRRAEDTQASVPPILARARGTETLDERRVR